ncbi:hypothetical protein KAR91_72995 [Candidatus Pacearchaeota archaeon]|nr:hypothetical protein [Candidatus Pacearchaeota archaeon]
MWLLHARLCDELMTHGSLIGSGSTCSVVAQPTTDDAKIISSAIAENISNFVIIGL